MCVYVSACVPTCVCVRVCAFADARVGARMRVRMCLGVRDRMSINIIRISQMQT